MIPRAVGASMVAIGLLSGGLAGAWRSAEGVVDRLGGAPDGEVVSTLRPGSLPASPGAWSCGPGPGRLSEMEVTSGGYRKVVTGAETRPHQFYLARAIYTGFRGGGFFGGPSDRLGDRGPSWSIDYPNADRVMTRVATRLSNLDACGWEIPVSLADPDIRRYPFLYSLEWGYADLTPTEIDGLRGYLDAGGFLMLDDFWGTGEWRNVQYQLGRVLPGRTIVDVPRDHPVFRSYYEIEEEIVQVPNVGNGRDVARGIPGARTWERDGYEAHLRGIFDDDGRLMVAINWNTDLGDALEWAESPMYPLSYSTFASRLFLNLIIYAMAY